MSACWVAREWFLEEVRGKGSSEEIVGIDLRQPHQ